ncbi:anaerobic sulfatase maturase [Marinomonas sp. TI.3.20]|uniref:anaerobic sulfatase maturase n=1 Tax=Marinomonas sp. TI.3.20 TaxID=3121296 RepID=UPI00311DAB23
MTQSTVAGCHVMAKPSSSICNLDCTYCFYLEKEKLYPEQNKNWRMTEDTLERYIQQHIEAQMGLEVQFAWQGGEPTLMGVDFYRKVVALCAKYAGNKRISHAFQTNAILLNDEWCELFKANNFLIGVSIDGPQDLHDAYRVTRTNKSTHAKVMKGIEYLKKHRIEFNTLTVIHDLNAQHPERVYEFLKQIGSTYLQFIPLVEREAVNTTEDTQALTLVLPDEIEANVTSWSVPSKRYGDFLNGVFDVWVKADVGRIFVNMFDSTLATWCGHSSGSCITSETCGHAFALESNGDLYQCDHFVYPEHLLGNIHEISIKEMNNSPAAKKFGQDKAKTLNDDCLKCEYKFACHGGCPKHRFSVSRSGFLNHNYFCSGYTNFFKHTEPYMRLMAALINNKQSPANIMAIIQQQPKLLYSMFKVSKNSQCPCGSGEKFKRCCFAG